MTKFRQSILPAARKIKDFEKLMGTSFEYVVLLDSHVASLQTLADMARAHGKKLLLHADLIGGLKNDEAAAEYLCQIIRPAGVISTRASVIQKTKQNGLIAIQRLFLLDTIALEKSYVLLERSKPDYIEVLPGVIPHMIGEVLRRAEIPVFAGGLIRTAEDVENALAAGASAVTTSKRELWAKYERMERGE